MKRGPPHAPGILEIDLDAVAWNYRKLCELAAPARVAAVVKANGYGLGQDAVSAALAHAGAHLFFTAHLDEAIALRQFFTTAMPNRDVEIGVLNGLLPGEETAYTSHGLFPVLNDLGQIDLWQSYCRAQNLTETQNFAAIQLDTGMARLGLSPAETSRLIDDPTRAAGFQARYLISHMACADSPAHPLNQAQLTRFATARAAIPHQYAMLAASSAMFLGEDWHMDFVRPGVALYGVNPTSDQPNPMRQVVQLKARILQVREIDAHQTVGYGASYKAEKTTRVATVSAGYADGYLRALSNRACAFIGETKVPLIGRVSMDLTTFDVTDVPNCAPGDWISLINPQNSLDDLANAADTIGYEILTSLGNRYQRHYTGSSEIRAALGSAATIDG